MSKKKKSDQNQTAKWVGIALVALFIGSILWSMVVETLLPLWRSGDTTALVNNIVGLPIILLATGVIIYGGYRVILATFGAMGSGEMGEVSAETTPQTRWKNAQLLFKSWVPGGSIMLLGFGLMALGGWLINR